MGFPVTVPATYRPKEGREAKFFTLLKRHWPTLKKAGLVAPTSPRIWRASDKRTRRFEWKDATASDTAHRTPELALVKPVALPFAAE